MARYQLHVPMGYDSRGWHQVSPRNLQASFAGPVYDVIAYT